MHMIRHAENADADAIAAIYSPGIAERSATSETLPRSTADMAAKLAGAEHHPPPIDRNLHSCGSVCTHGAGELKHTDAGVYSVGIRSHGRAAIWYCRRPALWAAAAAAATGRNLQRRMLRTIEGAQG